MASATQLSVSAAAGSAGSGLSGLGGGGEERERRHFGEALRDGYVLCQCVFHLRIPGTLGLLCAASQVGFGTLDERC